MHKGACPTLNYNFSVTVYCHPYQLTKMSKSILIRTAYFCFCLLFIIICCEFQCGLPTLGTPSEFPMLSILISLYHASFPFSQVVNLNKAFCCLSTHSFISRTWQKYKKITYKIHEATTVTYKSVYRWLLTKLSWFICSITHTVKIKMVMVH